MTTRQCVVEKEQTHYGIAFVVKQASSFRSSSMTSNVNRKKTYWKKTAYFSRLRFFAMLSFRAFLFSFAVRVPQLCFFAIFRFALFIFCTPMFLLCLANLFSLSSHTPVCLHVFSLTSFIFTPRLNIFILFPVFPQHRRANAFLVQFRFLFTFAVAFAFVLSTFHSLSLFLSVCFFFFCVFII